MANSSITTSSDSTYFSKINSGDHGSQFQTNLFLTIFERLTLTNGDFQLAYEMADADKFDDVVVLLKDEGWFFQAKHTDTLTGTPTPITFEMLFPKDKERKSGDFSLYKYLVSYCIIKRKFNVNSKKVFIYTNRDLPSNGFNDNVTIVDRAVDKILDFSTKNKGLKVSDVTIEEIQTIVNRKFFALRDALIDFFQKGKVDLIIYEYKTPLAEVLEKNNNLVRFKSTFITGSNKLELKHLYEALEKINDNIESFQLKINEENNLKNQISNVFSGKSRHKSLPLLIDEDTVREFFNDLIFSVEQPDDLGPIMRDDLQEWMRTWLRPEYFGELNTERLQKSISIFQAAFDSINVKKNFKKYLKLADGIQCLEQIKTAKHFEQEKFCPFYINRRIGIADRDKPDEEDAIDRSNELSDTEFAKELTGQLASQKFILLSAEPGMGKTTVFQYIANEAQKMPNRLVYLVYFNKFQRALDDIESISNLEDVLSTFSKVLSQEHCENIKSVINVVNTTNRRIIIFFDAFDEITEEETTNKRCKGTRREKVLAIFEQLHNASNVQVVVDGRRHVKELLESHFNCKAMSLIAIDERDQTIFLKSYWKDLVSDETMFQEYVAHLLNLFRSNKNQALYEFTGLPLTLKMLAEVEKDGFKEYLEADSTNKKRLLDQKVVGLVDLFERFIEHSFIAKMTKLSPGWKLESEDYKSLLERFKLQHQLLAIQKFNIPGWQDVFKNSYIAYEYKNFTERLEKQNDKSPLVEVVNNRIKFVHLSYEEFFVAQFIYSNPEKIQCSDFKQTFCSESFKTVQGFLFTMLETTDDFGCLDTLLKDTNDNMNHKFSHEILIDATKFFKVFTYLIKTYYFNVNYKRSTGETALLIAAELGYTESVKLLIKQQADINCVNACGQTPLQLSAQNNHMDVLKFLLEKSAIVNVSDKDGWTPLHTAVKFGCLDTIKLLLKYNANLKSTNNLGQFPASIAIQRIKKCNSTIKYYSRKVSFATPECASRYSIYCSDKKKEFSEKLLLLREMMKLMIASSDDLNATNKLGETLLHHAARKGDEETVRLLLDYTVNIDVQDMEQQTSLLLAARYNHMGVLGFLLKKSANVNLADKNGWTPLHKVVKQGSTDAVELLLNYEVNLKIEDKSGQTPIHNMISLIKSCKSNKPKLELYLRSLKLMLKKLNDINAVNVHQQTLLHHAVKEGVEEVIDILLKREANINAPDMLRQTPLHIAALQKQTDVLKLLLENSADVNASDKDGVTALHIAVRHVSEDAVKLLLKHNANLKITNNAGETPTHIVITRIRKCKADMEYYTRKLKVSSDSTSSTTNNQTNSFSKELKKVTNQQIIFKNLLNLMISQLDDVNSVFQHEQTLLHHAAKEGVEEAVDLLLKRSAIVDVLDVNRQTPLYLATLNKRFDMLKLLLGVSANVNLADKDGLTPLHIAAREGFEETFKLLLEHDAKLNTQNVLGQTAAHIAIASIKACKLKKDDCKKEESTLSGKIICKQNSLLEILKYILEKLDDVNAVYTNQRTLLHYAAEEGVEEAAHLLLRDSANVNAQDVDKQTPLYLAARCNNTVLLKLLLEASADVEIADKNGLTPLHMASTEGFLSVVELLLEQSAIVNVQDIDMKTPLYLATMNNQIEILELLLKNSADVNIVDDHGLSPLHIAAREGFIDVVKLLLKHNANCNGRDENGHTPLCLAKLGGHDEIVKLLRKKTGCLGYPRLPVVLFVSVTFLGLYSCLKFFGLKQMLGKLISFCNVQSFLKYNSRNS